MLATACAGNAFAPAGEAEAFGRRRLDAHLVRSKLEDFGNASRIAARWGPILRLLGDDRAIHMVDDSAAIADQRGRMG